MADKILEMFFDLDRWTKAIAKGVGKDIRKDQLIHLASEHTRLAIASAMKHGEYFTLEEMQAAVGGMVEIIELADKQSMILNEEGKLLDLPYNEQADEIFHQHYTTQDYIVGDVLLCENELIR